MTFTVIYEYLKYNNLKIIQKFLSNFQNNFILKNNIFIIYYHLFLIHYFNKNKISNWNFNNILNKQNIINTSIKLITNNDFLVYTHKNMIQEEYLHHLKFLNNITLSDIVSGVNTYSLVL